MNAVLGGFRELGNAAIYNEIVSFVTIIYGTHSAHVALLARCAVYQIPFSVSTARHEEEQ